MSPEEVIQYEQTASQLLRMYGAPAWFYDQQSDFNNLILNGVSTVELEQRLAGAYNTVQAKKIAMSEAELVLDAVRGALADSGLSPSDVDGNNVSSWVTRLNPRSVAQWFGGRPSWTGTSHPGIESVLEKAEATEVTITALVLLGLAFAAWFGLGAVRTNEASTASEIVEAALAMKKYAQEDIGLKRLVAVVDPENLPSIHLLEKLGMKFESMVRLSTDDIELKLFSMDL